MLRPLLADFDEVVITIRLKRGWAARCLTLAGRLPRVDLLARSMAAASLGFALCANTTADVPSVKPIPVAVSKPDPRAAMLERFFRVYGCPAPHHVAEYLRAADSYELDYRLLPAISIRETLCGVGAWQNNRWGYHPGQQSFPSVEVGIDFVAQVLAEGVHYKGKTLDQKLFTYNPKTKYPEEVKGIMRQIE
jgi:hypothetical protein